MKLKREKLKEILFDWFGNESGPISKKVIDAIESIYLPEIERLEQIVDGASSSEIVPLDRLITQLVAHLKVKHTHTLLRPFLEKAMEILNTEEP